MEITFPARRQVDQDIIFTEGQLYWFPFQPHLPLLHLSAGLCLKSNDPGRSAKFINPQRRIGAHAPEFLHPKRKHQVIIAPMSKASILSFRSIADNTMIGKGLNPRLVKWQVHHMVVKSD
jgi:hypothetical protein